MKQINQLIPYKRLLSLLLLFAVSVQIIIISYNHYTGFIDVQGPGDFFIRLIYSSVLSFVASMFLAYPDLAVIRYLNNRFSWQSRLWRRIALDLLFSIVIAIIAATAITLLAHTIDPYQEPLARVVITNNLITMVINILLMTALESTVFYTQIREEKRRSDALSQELNKIKFEVLKSQINPHFLFNSLNVLSGLIQKDQDKAQDFVDEFSHIYRYVLESIEEPLVSLEKELDFINAYMYLQQIRYGKSIEYSIDIPAAMLRYQMPPLSLQVVFENAIKHNQFTGEAPLNIKITVDDHKLVVSNTYRPKVSKYDRKGIGQQNLQRRYALLGNEKPAFRITENNYIVELPLIKVD
ncbi:MAG: histidine kinase [Bacteroidales bacterium]|nr:histidine kinase [Bacteroidales bacterium]